MSKKSNTVDFSAISEDKIGTGDPDVASGKALKGPSHKERKDMYQEGKKAMARAAMKKEASSSWKKKVGAMVALFFMCGVGMFQFLSAVYGFARGNGIENVDVKDTAKLKTVLFSGDPWLVYCVNNDTQNHRLPQVLEEGCLSIWSSYSMRTAILHCWEPTESGRSVAQRFKLNLKPPLSFVVANGNNPKMINFAGMKPEDLEKRVKPALDLSIARIDTLKKWPTHCTSRKTCIVIGHKNVAQRDHAQKMFPKAFLERHRGSRIVTLDTTFWQLKLGDAVMKTRVAQGKKGKSAEVICLSRDEGDQKKANSTHSGMFLGELDEDALDGFIQACENREGVVQLEKPPKINARPSKPKKVKAPPPPRPRPRPPPPPVKPKKAKVDSVGSRASLEEEEPLFEAVEEEEEQTQEEQTEEDEEDGGEEVEEGDDSSDDDEVEL